MYDYIIIGSGFFGSVLSHELRKSNHKILLIEKLSHIGGNCYTEKYKNIHIHKYGPHIFHTANEKIWNYINQFDSFYNYSHRIKVNYKNNLYSFPINLFTLYQLWNIKTPEEALNKLNQVKIKIDSPKNLEEHILSQVGEEIYEIFIKGYTIKQWQKEPKDLPISIISRIPIRLNFNDRYYLDTHKFEGIPENGYTYIFEKLLNHKNIELKLSTDYFNDKNSFDNLGKRIIYSGPIDKFFNHKYGILEYRSIHLENKILNIQDYQGCAVINYTEKEIPYTRCIEHKHFLNTKCDQTVISFEYPQKYDGTNIPSYPIRNEENIKKYEMYKKESISLSPKYIFGGRLGSYQYFDMDMCIGQALNVFSCL